MQLISSGADGLLKLWSVRTSECTDTFDSHEGKVWALDAAGENDRLVASGAADGALVVWEDRTAARQAQLAEEAALNIENQQALSNALQVRSLHACAFLCQLCSCQKLQLDHRRCQRSWAAAAWQLQSEHCAQPHISPNLPRLSLLCSVHASFNALPLQPEWVSVHVQSHLLAVTTTTRLCLNGQADNFAEAARLAFQLNQPGRLLSVITTAVDRGPGQCSSILQQLVGGWTPEQLALALKLIAQWNTNARHCHAAHALLHAILLRHPIEV